MGSLSYPWQFDSCHLTKTYHNNFILSHRLIFHRLSSPLQVASLQITRDKSYSDCALPVMPRHVGHAHFEIKLNSQKLYLHDLHVSHDTVSQCDDSEEGNHYPVHTTSSTQQKLISFGTHQLWMSWDTLSSPGKQFIISFIDCFSKYVVQVPTAILDITTVAHAFMEHVISESDNPISIFSDQCSEFTIFLQESLQKPLVAPWYVHPCSTHRVTPLLNMPYCTINNLLWATLTELR